VSQRIASFRERLQSGRRLIGTFVKTPHFLVAELLGHSTLDCICIDAEHAAFDRSTLDAVLLATRAADLPALVRVPISEPSIILNALDLGATGVVIPHVTTAEHAADVANSCRFGSRGRGYAGSTRAAGYATRAMLDVIAEANQRTTVIAQIEDAEALENIEGIAAVEAIDCLFVGRMDLTVSLGASSPKDPVVVEAVRRICNAASKHHRPVGMFTPTVAESAQWFDAGASLFLLESDQQWLLRGANEMVSVFRAL
jgi:2-keto-3-deoxy-L-rhamnonate aldolase RhmA